MNNSKIVGVGHYVPEKVVTNFDLEELMDTSDEWIKERTGIEERRFFDPENDTVSNMSAKASRMDTGILSIEEVFRKMSWWL